MLHLFLTLLLGCPRGKPSDSSPETGSGHTGETGGQVVDTSGPGHTGATGETGGETAETGRETGDSARDTDSHSGAPVDTVDTESEGTTYVDVTTDAWLTVYHEDTVWSVFGFPYVLGDVTGDGIDDVCFTSDEDDWFCAGFRSPVRGGVVEALEADFLLRNSCILNGVGVVGDVNGDGIDDVNVSGTVVLGPVDDEETDETADIVFLNDDSSGIHLYSRQHDPFDADGDGRGDVVLDVLEDIEAEDLTYDDRLQIYTGLDGGDVDLGDATATITSHFSLGDWLLFEAAPSSADFDGDGFEDLLVLDWETVMVYLGPVSGYAPEEDTDLTEDIARVTSPGDVNGDGYADVLTSRGRYSDGEEGAGLFYGPLAAAETWEGADVKFYFDDVPITYGAVLTESPVGDVNSDGLDDIAVEKYRYDISLAQELLIFESPFGDTVVESEVDIRVSGGFQAVDSDGPADLDGDWRVDLVVNDSHDTGAGGIGTGWVVLGSLL